MVRDALALILLILLVRVRNCSYLFFGEAFSLDAARPDPRAAPGDKNALLMPFDFALVAAQRDATEVASVTLALGEDHIPLLESLLGRGFKECREVPCLQRDGHGMHVEPTQEADHVLDR